jgi:transcriptional regulator with XRE-family HTH domain
MKSPWTRARDQRLMAYQAQGLSAREIAAKLGTSRSAVIGRSIRLRGIVYQSNIDSWKRANAKRKKGPRKPEAMRRQAIAQMAKDLRRGVPRAEAMLRASAGALWRDIGDFFGVSSKAAHAAANDWKRRSPAEREKLAIKQRAREQPRKKS